MPSVEHRRKAEKMGNDVVIIGGGLAGMTAAYAAQQQGVRCVLVDRGPAGIGTNSALANGVFGGPTPQYSWNTYVSDTLEAGRHINRTTVVDLIAQQAFDIVGFLRSLDLNVVVTPRNYIIASRDPRVIPGVELMKSLSDAVARTGRVQILRDFHVTDILTGDKRVVGVRGIDGKGEERSILSNAVILAAGGAGAIYLRNDNQKKILGQGYDLAARAGLQLWDMEFVQFYPMVLAEPHLPQFIVYPPYPGEVKLVNAAGEDLIDKYNLGSLDAAIRDKRDEASARLFEEGTVYMDFRGVPTHLWDSHPLSILKRLRFDFRSRPVAVGPAAHFCMGGVRTNESGATDIDGLFACGEILWGFHGANRMGGNALTECVVTGRIAGESAAGRCRAFPETRGDEASASGPEPGAHVEKLSKVDFRGLLAQAREIAWRHAGVIRSGEGMREGLKKIASLKESLQGASVNSAAERIQKRDLAAALLVIEAILASGLGRQESRGSCIRSDFPEEDNLNWRKNSCLEYAGEEEGFSLSFHPAI